MRAIFKCVLDGKQAALLSPTTILTDQHFRTLKRRFAAFPVSIDILTRFRGKDDQKELLRRLQEGTLDVVVGTHRLSQQGRRVQGPRPPRRGRGAALRRGAERAHQGVARVGGRPRDVGDPDSTLAPPVARGHPRPFRHRDAAEGPPRDRDARRAGGRRGHPRRDPRGGRPRRAGLRRPQPHRLARLLAREARGARAGGPGRHGPRPDVGGRARARDARVRHARGRSPPRHDDRRERPRHPVGEHDAHRPRRDVRSLAALPAPRARRPQRQGRGVLAPRAARDRGLGRRAPAPARDPGVLGPRRGVPHRGEGPRNPRRGESPRRGAVGAHRVGGLRDLREPPRGGDGRAEGRAGARDARRDASARRTARDSTGVDSGGEPAHGAVQEDRCGVRRGDARTARLWPRPTATVRRRRRSRGCSTSRASASSRVPSA